MESIPRTRLETAENYAHARPDYHSTAIAVAARLLDLRSVTRAVDIGCGTGMSSRALAAVAGQVIGLDTSRPMLRSAAPWTGVHYVQAAAERLPLATGSAELVVTAAAFHWFDQPAMLAETTRLLRRGGAFVAYTDFFSGQLIGADHCSDWLANTYRTRLPRPPRGNHFDVDAAETAGFRFVGVENLAHEVPMTADGLTNYLLSQSNSTSAVDAGRCTMSELRNWVRDEFRKRWPPGPVVAVFTGSVWCCRKAI